MAKSAARAAAKQATRRAEALMVRVIIMGGAMTAVTPAPPRGIPRAILFDAGNTLLRMDYAVIAAALAARGHAVDAPAVREAELRARVRLDADLAVPRTSTESAAIHAR